ncbi:DUF4907 domain-containing protein [Winogradskyella thalassocola]|uniref:DUF4907 domain-containing protein n=1 Tax=Winogradskyella thalassocola TaxID=262004 RepID=A0A1G8B6V2_9FLAO|nr:DUF4907 domain-containing protein [Winogradskyella thalassocola]SDH28927.1 protein of unknown function [Winogradskyella thalassocola]
MKRNNNYKIVLLGVTILFIVFFYIQSGSNETKTVKDTAYALQVIEQDSLWIYEVYNQDSLFIRQEYIPAAKGQQGFKSKADAEKIGKLVIRKLSENKMPVIRITDLYANAIDFKNI